MRTVERDALSFDEAPFSGLTPELVLDAVEALGLSVSGTSYALNSFENRVFWVGLERQAGLGRAAVVKFYRPQRWTDAQILEEHAFSQELADEEIPAVAPLQSAGRTLFSLSGFRYAVFPCRPGRAPDPSDPATLERLGAYIGRIHAVGARHPFRSRPALTPETFGERPIQALAKGDSIPEDLRKPWIAAASEALRRVQDIWHSVEPLSTLRLHGDAHLGNVLMTEDGAHFVDFDDCRQGPAVQDLWMMLPDGAGAGALADLLAGYETFREFRWAELRLVEPLRTLRMIHYSAWIARRWLDPAFPAAFPWFGTETYWRERIAELQGQVAAMRDTARSAP